MSINIGREFVCFGSTPGGGYVIKYSELLPIYEEFQAGTDCEDYLVVILKNFEILRDFCTEYCGVGYIDFDIIESKNYVTQEEAVKYVKENCENLDEMFEVLDLVKEPNTSIFELIEYSYFDKPVLASLGGNDCEHIDNIANRFMSTMETFENTRELYDYE